MPGEDVSSPLVVIGASAGGIDALSALLSTLPSTFPAPIVIAQHLDPTRASHLGEILSRRSALPVHTIDEHAPLTPGVVYAVPANRDVFINDHEVGLRAGTAGHAKPSVDILLSSAAEHFGERLIAVILSGSGSDGAAGARVVKRAGGTVIIQDPNTAAFPSMPLSLAPNVVDVAAPVERIGQLLVSLATGGSLPARAHDTKALSVFLDEVRERYGIDFTNYKTSTILRRLQRRIVATDSDTLENYTRYVQTHPEEFQQLVNTFLTKVTEFFRDPELFDHLRARVLPELISQASRRSNELRIWSAGCATGEEAYSLAILVSEALKNDLERFHVRIFGTDADPQAIAYARRGIFPPNALTGLPEELVRRYFIEVDGNFQVHKRVRALTVFGHHDLGARAPFPNTDLIMCRNELIYFTSDLQQRTLQIFAYSLRGGGYLVLGKAESIGEFTDLFTPEHTQLEVFRRHGDRMLVPPTHYTSPMTVPPPMGLVKRNSTDPNPSSHELQRMRSLNESLMSQLPVGVAVVDRHYDIQAINSAARRFLAIHGPAVGDDLIHMAQGIPHTKLRAAIDAAFRDGQMSTVDDVAVEEVTTGETRYLDMRCYPHPGEGTPERAELVVIVVQDITSLVTTRHNVEAQLSATTAALQQERAAAAEQATRHQQMIDRLVQNNRQLMDANQELTGVNEELRTANEEMLLNTEEAQAATEEVETLNEEMQATNEELETLNEELQATVEELNTTNDDLAARSVELQEMATAAEAERARLAAILASIGEAVLVVNQQGEFVLTNASYKQMFGSAGARFAARDDTGHSLPADATPQRRAARGESFSMEFTMSGPDGTQHFFECTGRPIRDAAGTQQGGVVVFRDITDRSLRRLQEEFISRASHELRTPLTPLQGYLQRLIQALPQDQQGNEEIRRHAQRALSQATRLSRLVGDLLDATQLQRGSYTIKHEPLRLDELLERIVEMAQMMASGQTVVLDAADGPLFVSGDADRLEQALLNLLSNAIAYAPGTQRIDVRLRRDGGQAELQIQDYGVGIPANELPNIFSRFYQVPSEQIPAHRGLGLGLFIAREITTAHGGTLTADSVEGQGTTFTLRLPLLDAAPPAEQAT